MTISTWARVRCAGRLVRRNSPKRGTVSHTTVALGQRPTSRAYVDEEMFYAAIVELLDLDYCAGAALAFANRRAGVRLRGLVSAYHEMLRDPRWQRMRLEVMQRDHFRCVECGDERTTLNVHHTYYAKGKKPWEYEARALRTLCEPCHKKISDVLADLTRLIGGLDLNAVGLVTQLIRDDIMRDVATAIADPLRVCAICGAHRGMQPGKLLCASCRYAPHRDEID